MSTLWFGPLALSGADWLLLFGHFLMLSLLAVGGALITAPEMQRFIVNQHGWLSDAQFTASVALAQAAPGPNLLFVVVVGYNVGGLAGSAAALIGTLLPSTLLALTATRWAERHQQSFGVRAFKAGMAPLTIGLLLSTSWILLEPVSRQWHAVLLVAATLALVLNTSLNLLWLMAAGAGLGMLGWV